MPASTKPEATRNLITKKNTAQNISGFPAGVARPCADVSDPSTESHAQGMSDFPAGVARPRVLVALSGGVDSSACVYLLQKQGYEVEAVVLDLSPAHAPTVAAAQETAALLGVRLHVAKRHDDFMQQVVLPFCAMYRAGQTPNPCVMCNPTVKFKHILQCANELGFDFIATGHYASIEQRNADGAYLLKRADCLPRDQSYMLYRLGQDVLSRLLLPLQHLAKDEVRKIAADANLPCATKPDSQEICFIPSNNYPAYIENLLGKSPAGDFIAPDGKPCGKHRGILHYTVGQRKGLGIALGRPVFIRKIDPDSNRIYLADSGGEYDREILLDNCVFHPAWDMQGAARCENYNCTEAMSGLSTKNCENGLPGLPAGAARSLGVKIRSVSQPAPAIITADGTAAKVVFDTPQRAPAPGQSAVWYCGDYVAGGGYIRSV